MKICTWIRVASYYLPSFLTYITFVASTKGSCFQSLIGPRCLRNPHVLFPSSPPIRHAPHDIPVPSAYTPYAATEPQILLRAHRKIFHHLVPVRPV